MKIRTQKLKALMLVTALGTTAFGSMPVIAAENTDTADVEESAEAEGESISADMIAGTFKPSGTTVPAQDSYEYPFLGMKFSIPKTLQKQMKEQSVAMVTTEDETSQAEAVTYAYVSWNEMTEEQKNAEVEKLGTGYEDWVADLFRIGTLGVYDEASQKKLDEIQAVQSIKNWEVLKTESINII